MCNFFSFVTDPVNHPAEYYCFDWEYRKEYLEADDADSHSHICAHFRLNEDRCNKYEFNPLTKMFTVDQINSERDDSEAAEKWANRQDIKTIVEPLIVKPIINLLKLPKVEKPTSEQIGWLKEWASVLDSVWTSVWDSAGASVGDLVLDSVGASVGASVLDSVRASAWASVGASVGDLVRASVLDSVRAPVFDSVLASEWAFISTFFDIGYKVDFSPAVKLWESGLVPSFDGTTWRLHSGENADIVFEWIPEVQK